MELYFKLIGYYGTDVYLKGPGGKVFTIPDVDIEAANKRLVKAGFGRMNELKKEDL